MTMMFIFRTLAMIISMQLAIGCNGEQLIFKSDSVVGVDEIEISSSIAGSFNTIFNFVFSSAMASETGTLQIFDASDPTLLELIHKEDLVNQSNYSVIFKKSLVDGRLLKVEFIGAAKSRIFLTKPEVETKVLSVKRC
jgi:hypothetical protein